MAAQLQAWEAPFLTQNAGSHHGAEDVADGGHQRPCKHADSKQAFNVWQMPDRSGVSSRADAAAAERQSRRRHGDGAAVAEGGKWRAFTLRCYRLCVLQWSVSHPNHTTQGSRLGKMASGAHKDELQRLQTRGGTGIALSTPPASPPVLSLAATSAVILPPPLSAAGEYGRSWGSSRCTLPQPRGAVAGQGYDSANHGQCEQECQARPRPCICQVQRRPP